MAKATSKLPQVKAVYGERKSEAVVRFDLPIKGGTMTLVASVDGSRVEIYRPGSVHVMHVSGAVPPKGPRGNDWAVIVTGSVPPKGPRGNEVDVFATRAAPPTPKAQDRKKGKKKEGKTKKGLPAPTVLAFDGSVSPKRAIG